MHRSESGELIMQAFMRNITEKKKLEALFLQSQKMEAVGQLAGGVAHDFNNLLTVISGHCELLKMQLQSEDPLMDDVNQIRAAASRAGQLTKQLLTFSRKQIPEFKIIDFNTIVKEMEKMLRRLLGEDIELQTKLVEGLSNIDADRGQIEQMIMNLTVNARDAMPKGGKLAIETQKVLLDQEYASLHPEVKPGRYIQLTVCDTGCGMSKETLEHLFEPFFTTKETGKGTGLGLATVFGIIKQHQGYIQVYSEVGMGSVFTVYLPLVAAEEAAEEKTERLSPDSIKGSESILVAEDQEEIRELVIRVLKKYGYQVFAAADGYEALKRVRETTGVIDLFLTDVVMPHTEILPVVEEIKKQRPGIKVLYMSGYTDEVISYKGVLRPDVKLLRKPFTPLDLVKRVREVLDK